VPSHPETVLQFGTGKFLRAFADLFIAQANRTAAPVGRVVVVQSTGSGRAESFARCSRYQVAIRGIQAGQIVDRIETVDSIARALSAPEQWPEVLALAETADLRVVISNTTEAGYQLAAGDSPERMPPQSFPAKLLCVLEARYQAGLPGLMILPCELLENNADRLRTLVLEQARQWNRPPAVCDWIETACHWHNTLVDRIVSAPSPGDPLAAADPLFAVAEPFAFWGVEGPLDVPGLAAHPAVHVVEDLLPLSLRKVRILNGAHTALVAKARPLGLQTVREALANEEIRRWLATILFDEIVPVLEGRTDDPAGFAREVLDRFANPFLDHRLADIALHDNAKRQTRLVPTLTEYLAQFGRTPPGLGEILGLKC
jgi:tagaturonate reductase